MHGCWIKELKIVEAVMRAQEKNLLKILDKGDSVNYWIISRMGVYIQIFGDGFVILFRNIKAFIILKKSVLFLHSVKSRILYKVRVFRLGSWKFSNIFSAISNSSISIYLRIFSTRSISNARGMMILRNEMLRWFSRLILRWAECYI
jgi:hypothetical protein